MKSLFKKRKKFGEIAVEKGFITARQLTHALAEQGEIRSKGLVHKKIGAILLEKGFVEIEDINEILVEQEKSTFLSWASAFFSLRRGV